MRHTMQTGPNQASPKLTLEQRVNRIPNAHKPTWLWHTIMRAPGDLRIANQIGRRGWQSRVGREQRAEAMRRMAIAINALRRAEKAAGLSARESV